MKENPYLQYGFQMLKSFEHSYKEDIKDSSLTPRAQANARTKLAQVREAMRSK